MTRPIATPAHVPARTRRRQRSSALLRLALLLALLAACVFTLPTAIGQLRALGLVGDMGGPTGRGPGAVDSQVALSGLQSGACMSFSPTGGHGSKTVFIDPGHGGLDPGVVGDAGGRPVQEKDVTLAVGTTLASLLERDGFRVVMSRTADTSVAALSPSESVTGALTASAVHRDLVTRTACANAADAAALLSIHFDGFSDPTVAGTETFYDSARPFAGDNKRLALDLQRELVAALGTNDRGVWTDDQLAAPTLTVAGSAYGHLIELGPPATGWVDNPSQMPGALVEPLFLTNQGDARIAGGTAGQERMAEALKTGLEKFLAGS